MNKDPLTNAVRTFFRSQMAQDGTSLNFDDLPVAVSVPRDEQTGAYSPARAREYLSRFVADNVAVVDHGVRQIRSGSLSDQIRFTIVEQATPYLNPDRSDAALKRDREAVEKMVAEAKRRFEQLASVGGLPVGFVPSEADPANWMDPDAKDLWRHHSQVILGESKEPEKDDDGDPAGWPSAALLPKFPIFTRAVNPDIMKVFLEGVRPRRPDPPWIGPGPDPTPDFGLKALGRGNGFPGIGGLRGVSQQKQEAGGSGTAEGSLLRLASFDPSASSLSFARGLPSADRLRAPAGAVPLGADDTFDPESLVLPNNLLEQGLDGAALDPAVSSLTADQIGVVRSGLLYAGLTAEKLAERDQLEMSFEYQVVRIVRPWLFLPLLQASSWYVPGMLRGRIAGGGEAAGVVQVIPSAIIVIRDVTLKASFTDDEAGALGGALMIGPFALGRRASVNQGELRIPGMQIVGYLDEPLPVIPGKSDPSLQI